MGSKILTTGLVLIGVSSGLITGCTSSNVSSRLTASESNAGPSAGQEASGPTDLQPTPPSESAQPEAPPVSVNDNAWCVVRGVAGETAFCEVRVAREALNSPAPMGLGLTLEFEPSILFYGWQYHACGTPDCPPDDTLPGGHEVVLEPSLVADWAGSGSLTLVPAPEPQILTSAALDVGDEPEIVLWAVFRVVDEATQTEVRVSDLVAMAPPGGRIDSVYRDADSIVVRSSWTGEQAECLVDSDCDDGLACTEDSCSTDGQCVSDTGGLACVIGGICITGGAANPENQCEYCAAESAPTMWSANNGAACDDGNACTAMDQCDANTCIGATTLVCDDGNVCTTDSCDVELGCVFAAESGPCDDGDACTAADECVGGDCRPGDPLDCDDGNVCTVDTCDSAVGCLQSPDTGAACDDGDVCSGPNTCTVDGQCEPEGGPLDCDDGNVCTTDACEPALGCTYLPNSQPCEDGNACTTADGCIAGACVPGAPAQCNDSNSCTTDSCDPAVGCVHAATVDAPCDDGDVCNGNDSCSDAGLCEPVGPAVECDDGNPCTDDLCLADSGCSFPDNTAPCDDGDLCTAGDACGAGACQAGAPVDCTDENVCTDEVCIPSQGCVITYNNNPCEDGDLCTVGDQCDDGSCANPQFTLKQGEFEFTLTPLQSGESIEEFYQYDTPDHSSANTGFELPGRAAFLLHEDPTGELGLVFILDEAKDGSGGDAVVNFTGLPELNFVVADDPHETYDPLTGNITWNWLKCCTDGAAIEPLPKGACFTVSPVSFGDIDELAIVNGDGSVVALPSLFEPVEVCSACIGEAGQCNPGVPADCNDGDECTSDSCEPITGQCVNSAQGECP